MLKTRPYPKRQTNQPCAFCETGLVPDYKEAKSLRSYLTDKGKIVPRTRSGVCLTHQRALTLAVKRARYLAMLPYVSLAR
ncbi:30S ribosomal protein S18 [Microgenomates group bacterium RBG_16_45_19]|nr:MAG: 30S ribosomal protein S18 [Microgenomates group bacterium RBG_16_45_19]